MFPPLLGCSALRKTICDPNPIEILKGINFQIREGETVAITGTSGTGKTTFLHLLALLDSPSRGTIQIRGKNVDGSQGALWRRQYMALVFQGFYLIDEWTALNNALLPALICGDLNQNAKERGKELLVRMGLEKRMRTRASALSGGEKQRLSLARALLRRPKVILADEVTGNLDKETSLSVQNALFEQVELEKSALILVTHDENLAQRCQRGYRLQEGKLSEFSK